MSSILRRACTPLVQHYAHTKRSVLILYVVLWYAVITTISHLPGSSSSVTAHWFGADGLIDWNMVFRFSAHCGVFGLLAMLIYGAVQHDLQWQMRAWSIAIGCTALGGFFDEYHQAFVPGRFFKWSDVALDTSAGAIAIILLCRILHYVMRDHVVKPLTIENRL